MDSFEASNFKRMDNGNFEYFVHHRPLGKKVNGLYQHVPWSDIAIQNVPLETTLHLENQNKFIEYMNYIESMKGTIKKVINERNLDNKIRYSGTNRLQFNKEYIDPYRSRSIPKKKKKKFPVKPKLPYTKTNKVVSYL
jgi:hypothetical protein